jgi:signal transduction histidine kinase/DNA-binding response OmpR family regulator
LKTEMSSKSKLSGTRISTKLLAINALISIVFFLIVLMVFISFHHIQGLIKSVIVDDMNEVTTNALTERELSTILADTNLLLNTFFKNEEYLNTEGNRLLAFSRVLVNRNKGRDLEEPLQEFARRLGFVLQQCEIVNTSLRGLRVVEQSVMAIINRLEEIISEKLIDLAFKGEDISILEQLSVLIAGYRQSLLQIGKLHAESWPKEYYTPISTENYAMFVAVDDLILRSRTVMASEPQIAELGRKLINDLQTYRRILHQLNAVMIELKSRMDAIENTKEQVTEVMERLDSDIAQVTRAVDKKITHSFRITEIVILLISVSLVIALIRLTTIFFKRIIKSPMDEIRDGIKAFRSGNLGSRIRLNRRDEWHLIEDALNTMAAELSTSYTALQRAQGELEAKVMERTTELSNAKEQALEAQRTAEAANQAKSEFLARMSHEIRTPLNAVTGLTNILLKSELTAEQRDYLNKVQIASNNLLEVINDILDFSKVESGRLELAHDPFDLDQVLEQLVDLFSNRVGQKDLELILTTAPDVPRQLTGDAGRLTQVLTNLVENAVKFSENGEIVVGVEPDDQAEKLPGQAALKFRVSDTGIGIAADVLPTLFEAFTQADSYLTRKHQGSGLGLAICRRLAELMGGTVEAQSTPSQGSTFSFAVVLETRKEAKPNLILPADLRGLKTLVVDDSATARQVLVDLLESFTFNVAAVDSGEKAIEALRRADQSGPYQLVLLDWKMPGMDGIETAATISSDHCLHRPPIIILVTAYGRELVQEHMDKAAVDSMLLKPVKPSQLFNTIMELFGRADVAVPRRAKEPTALPTHQLAGRRVLVVEDSELNRDVAVALMEEMGIVVETAENGRIAMDIVTGSPRGYYDAVLMDIQMPVMDGYEATRKIREFEEKQDATSEQPETRTPIIALTAHALKGEKEKCLAGDMDDYLAKPLDEKDLHRVLFKWIAPQHDQR